MKKVAKAIAWGAVVFLMWVVGTIAILSAVIVTTPTGPNIQRSTFVYENEYGDYVGIDGMWLVNDALERLNVSTIRCSRPSGLCWEASAYEFGHDGGHDMILSELHSYDIVAWEKGRNLIFKDSHSCGETVYRVDLRDTKNPSVYGERKFKSLGETGDLPGCLENAGRIEKLRMPINGDEAFQLFNQERAKRQWMPQRLFLALFLVAVWTVLVCYRRRFSIRYVPRLRTSDSGTAMTPQLSGSAKTATAELT